MPDMLVKLYDFKPDTALYARLESEGIFIKRVISPEKTAVVEWVRNHFSNGWADECEVAISNYPSSCFVAYTKDENGSVIVGFACCETTYKNFFGPTGVDESMRGKGVGKALLHKCLEYQQNMGYGYSIIGGTSVFDFYRKACGAVIIEDSKPGIYRDMIRAKHV